MPPDALSTLRRAYAGVRRRLGLGPVPADNFFVDILWRIEPDAYYVKAWLWDPQRRVSALLACPPDGVEIDVLPRLHRHERPDVARFFSASNDGSDPQRSGLVGLVTLPAAVHATTGWRFRMVTVDGARAEKRVGVSEGDALHKRQVILTDLGETTPVSDHFLREHVHPAMSRLNRRIPSRADVTNVVAYGRLVDHPRLSVVVPLYRRVDFVEQQMAQFAGDPAMRETELVYVLDSPELAESLYMLAPRLYELYRVPFRLAVLARNSGYALATNAGADLARGGLLLLLNSDVIPDGPGWLESMASAHASIASPGALGPKLLYEDESIQHAGLYFRRLHEPPEWSNEHFFKGYHRDFGPACLTRPVPAVTGACLLVDRALFHDLGGLRGDFVQGDYEDSDLCLRAIESGRQNWYLSNIELFHLEAQSYAGAARRPATRYNRWLHTQLWDEQIGRVMRQFGAEPSREQPDPQ